MSVSDFLSSIADKAQTAINQTPLAGHIPGTTPAGVPAPGPAGDHSHNPATQQAGHRSFALESLQHTIRSIGQQYTSTNPIQRIITLEKGVALDYDALARDSKTQSKETYNWGRNEGADLMDVTDRLAYLNFVHGSLSGTLAVKLDGARTPLKALRDSEAALVPKRNIRAGLRNQIGRIEHHQEKGGERRISELKEQLARAETNDEQLEKEFELLKRKAIRESEQKKWEAIREYGEKLVLLSQGAKPIIDALPSLPPGDARPYTGAQATAAARAALQHALDNYKPGQDELNLRIETDLSRSDTRSFGETHASELHTLVSSAGGQESHPGLPVTPPPPQEITTTTPLAQESVSQDVPTNSASPRETGATPQSASPGTGSEEPIKSPSGDLYDTPVPKTESAEEEKKRLEREERERVLAGGAETKDGDELPPYKDIEE